MQQDIGGGDGEEQESDDIRQDGSGRIGSEHMGAGVSQQVREEGDHRHDEDIGEHSDERTGQPIFRIPLGNGEHRAEDEGGPDREQERETDFCDEKEAHGDKGHHDGGGGADAARDEEGELRQQAGARFGEEGFRQRREGIDHL